MLQPYLARMLIPPIVLIVLAACGDERAAEAVTTPGTSTAPAAEPADAADPVSAPFDLSIHAGQPTESVVHRGEPLLVEVLLILTGAESARIALADGAPWTHALSLALADPDGKTVEAGWTGLEQAGTDLEFSASATEIRAVAALSPEALDALAPGDYRLTAVFDTRDVAAPGTWTGRLVASTVPITLSADSAAQAIGYPVFRHRLLARWRQLSNHPQAALDELDTALLLSPEDIEVLADKAEVLVELQRNDEAIAMLQQAIELYGQRYPEATHPPRELIRRLNELSPY